MKNAKIARYISVVCNLAVFVLVFKAVLGFFFSVGEGNMQAAGVNAFIYFTIDSNILAAISCIVMVPFNIISIIRGEDKVPYPVRVFKFVGTASVAVTLFTVVLFLGPMQGYGKMFEGDVLWLHLVCPLLAIVSFVLAEASGDFRLGDSVFGLLPTIIYGTIYLIMVVVIGAENGGWYDFYGFNINGMWYLSFIFMVVGTYIISIGLYALRNLMAKKLKF